MAPMGPANAADGVHLVPVERRHAPLFSFALLTVSCALASFALACATPFAAFAVVAAATMPPRPAFAVVTGAWLVNQMIGFGALHYPVDAGTIAWGFMIGAAALTATGASAAALRATRRIGTPLALAVALVCAYAAYEVVLFAATPMLGGEGAFTAAIVARLGGLNLAWLIGLVAVCQVLRFINTFRRGHAVS